MRTATLALLTAALFGCASEPTPTDSSDPPDSDEAASMATATGRTFEATALPAQLATGDLVRHRGVAALVPPPGHGVTAEALGAGGRADTLSVRTTLDGRVEVHADGEALEGDTDGADADSADTATATGKCSDRRFNLFGNKWYATLEFWFNASTVPNTGWQALPADYAEEQIRQGGRNIVDAHNDCGRADHVNATISYQGHTTRGTNISATGACGDPDGYSVVAFKDFDDAHSDYYGFTCTWDITVPYLPWRVSYESDIRLARYYTVWWPQGHTCNDLAGDEYISLEAVMTHERGHSFGLAHVPNSPNLTMYPYSEACETRDRTLGLGDMLGLEALY